MSTTVAPSSDQAADLMQNLSLDSQPKALEISEPNKKLSANQYGTVDSNNIMNGHSQPYERSMTPLLQDFMDPAMCYLPNGGYPYYYGGFDGSADWDAGFMTQDGVEMTPEMYADNGAMGYHPGYGYGAYAPYSPAVSPVPSMGHDGQLYAPQHYQYPTPYFQPLTPSNGLYSPSPVMPAQVDVSTSAASDQKPVSVESANGIASEGGVMGNNVLAAVKSSYQNSSYNSNASFGKGGPVAGVYTASGYQDPRYTSDALRSTQWSDGSVYSGGQIKSGAANSIMNGNYVPSSRNKNLPQQSHYMGLHQPRPMSGVSRAQGFMNRMYPNKYYSQYGNTVRSTYGYGANGYDSRNGRGWYAVDNKYKPRGRGNGFYYENMEGLNELNRGPRARGSKNQKSLAPVTIAVKGQDGLLNETTDTEKDKSSDVPDREQYNLADFTVDYTYAKFFIIKSYSEDDVHKSIKYSVWASTPNGNKKLDAAYQEAQDKKYNGCPVFLFFSVNTSGQFVGLAEMASSVDFNKNLEYWQQDKWNGCFSLKWHIVKDVPNSLLKHIILENNENKPVTNSRDTQEVKLEQGLQMLKLFKEHSCKTCILDDFAFYEARQKTIQEKKDKQQQFQKQVWGGKQTDEKNKVGTNNELQSHQLLEFSSDSIKVASPVTLNVDRKLSENKSEAITTNGQMDTKPVVSEKMIVANGV